MKDNPPSIMNAEQMKQQKITNERLRIRWCILELRKQIKNVSVLDALLGCLTPAMAVDGRLPFTPCKLVLVEDRNTLVHNTLALAILKWGAFARGEKNGDNPELDFIESVATNGLRHYGAFPKERNSPVYVLRTVNEERVLRAKRAAAQERALEMKSRMRDAQEVLDEQNKTESDMVGRTGEVGGRTPEPVEPGASESDPEVPTA